MINCYNKLVHPMYKNLVNALNEDATTLIFVSASYFWLNVYSINPSYTLLKLATSLSVNENSIFAQNSPLLKPVNKSSSYVTWL